MKTNKIIMIVAVAAMFAACGKDKPSVTRLRIFSEDMATPSTKQWVNPSQLNSSSTWISGELIDLCGTSFGIAADDGFYLNVGNVDLPDDLYAIYPASTTAGGNDISVVNNGSGASTMVIRSLALNFHGAGHDVVFPMATGLAAKRDGKLLFKHLTGGFKLTLTDTSATRDYTVGSLKVVVYGDGSAPAPASAYGVTARWAMQGPVLPSGEVGSIVGNQYVGSASEMHFTLKTDGVAGKSIPSGGSIVLCVPVTVSSVKKLVVTAYSVEGTQLFVRTKELPTAQTIQPNHIYPVPQVMF